MFVVGHAERSPALIRYTLRRTFLTVPVLLGVTLAVFSMQHLLPGDPVKIMIMSSASGSAPSGGVTEEMLENFRHQLGLDRPLYVQFGSYLWGLLHGDLGKSFRSDRPVSEMLL